MREEGGERRRGKASVREKASEENGERKERREEEGGGNMQKRQTEPSGSPPSAWTNLGLTSLDPSIDACALREHFISSVHVHTHTHTHTHIVTSTPTWFCDTAVSGASPSCAVLDLAMLPGPDLSCISAL